MPNPFAHVELNTDDVKKAKKFYQSVFAWKLSDVPNMGYTMIDVSGGAGGGMQKKQMAEAPNAWLPYVQVDDLKATMAKAIKAGATAALEHQDIGDMGAIGIFIDPAGATLGLWQSKAPAAAPPPPAKPAAKKAAAKAAPAPAKKAAAKAAPAAAKKAAAKAAPAAAKKAPAKAAPAPAKKAPAKKAPAKKS